METMEFKVNGITFKNEQGKNIQNAIKKELRELQENGLIGEKWEGYTNKEIKEMDLNVQEYSDVEFIMKLEEDVFEGKKCVKLYIEKNDGEFLHVGYIPKNKLKEYEEKSKEAMSIIAIGELTGGRYKECIYNDEDEEVETVDLDYGIFVNVKFKYEDDKKNEEKNEKTVYEKKEQIEEIEKNIHSNEDKYFYLKLLFSFGCIGFIIYSIIRYVFSLILS